MKISILTDKTSWMNGYSQILADRLLDKGCEVSLIADQQELTMGDVTFLLSCFEKIPNEKLELSKNNIVVHASRLPKGKGWSPASWQILEGENIIPLTLFEATDSIDAGQIYLCDEIHLNGHELIDEWQRIMGQKIVEMCCEFIEKYDDLYPCQQSGEESFYRRRKPEDSELDPDKSITEQFNLLRIVDNEKYPAFFYYQGQKFVVRVSKEK